MSVATDAAPALRDASAPPCAPTFREALAFWLKLGFISFGGPAGQIAVMHQELVERRRWISERRFLHALNYCMLLPGPEAQQLATYIGWLLHRTWGGVVAGGLFVLPSLFILIAVSWIYVVYGAVPAVAGVLYGIKPAVTAIVVFAAYRIGSRALRKNPVLWSIAGAALVAVFAFHVPFPYIVLAAGVIGHVGGRVAPQRFQMGGHGSTAKDYGPAVIDDDTPPPAHARFVRRHTIVVAVVGVLFALAPLALLALLFGCDRHAHANGVVLHQGRLAHLRRRVCGAALRLPRCRGNARLARANPDDRRPGARETTPGPRSGGRLRAFVGEWAHAALGQSALFLSGAAGATVATFFTFLPSFLFILVGGPLVEATHGDLKFTAPLTGITAAVVGVILNLAVFFGYHVLWPGGIGDHFEWPSLVIGVAAAVALFRFKVGVIPVIGACGFAGLAWTLLRAAIGGT